MKVKKMKQLYMLYNFYKYYCKEKSVLIKVIPESVKLILSHPLFSLENQRMNAFLLACFIFTHWVKKKCKNLFALYLFPMPHIVKCCYKLYEVNDNAKADY